jgi:isoquinoline 1-oxidoreductase alpha subunit
MAVREMQGEPDTPLHWALREQAGLTGTKYGCGVAQCGACSVHINGEVGRSCVTPVGSLKRKTQLNTMNDAGLRE